jgi:hypothetical protein
VGADEKAKYEGKMKETGSYQGYKLRQYWVSCFSFTIYAMSYNS